MEFYMEFVYGNDDCGEPIVYDKFNDLVRALIEWYQMVNYIATQFRSTSRVVELIRPSSLLLTGEEGEVIVYQIHSKYLSEKVVVYSREN